MKILMCPPLYFDIAYVINPWMSFTHKVNTTSAWDQWNNLRLTLEHIGAEIYLIEPVPNLPDLVFTANAGLVLNHSVYPSHFLHPERQPEEPYYRHWFLTQGYKLLPTLPHDYFEGAGDALFAGKHLFTGFGIRSQKATYHSLQKYCADLVIIPCELVSPHFYHLDTCFCPLNQEQAIWWPHAFSDESQKRMQEQIALWAVPESEAYSFACNSVVIGNHVVLPAHCEQTEHYLQAQGFMTHACEMSEFLKAGGACKCLTLEI